MIYHGINYIPNPSNPLLNTAQDLAVQSINKFKTPDVKFVSLQFKGEAAAIGADISREIVNDSGKITERKLPYFWEVFNSIADCASEPQDWIGFTNSDIVISSGDFYTALQNSDNDVVLFNRVEIKDIELTRDLNMFLKQQGEPNPFEGRDGFFLRKSIWDTIKIGMPNYILAEPYWDIGLIELLDKYNPVVVQNHIYHYFHPRRWSRNTPGALYNLELYEKQKTNFLHTK